ncbi:MAG TPA: sigma-E factor regulatory protein RseB domain-containing protein [Jiangellales bacterium]|nr:sigma-E factor regulatory protein RseB domain-containing protein [Jiangellales bacterium]
MTSSPRGARADRPDRSPVPPAAALPAAVLLAVALLLVVPVFTPATPEAAAADADDDAPAVGLLQRSARSWSTVSFTGTQYLTLGGDTGSAGAVVEVVHRAGGPTRVHVLGTGRHELPASATRVWLAPAGPVDLLVDAYQIRPAGREPVVGRPADVVEARRPDGTLAARLWVDTATGLPLRRELFDTEGSVSQASAFVDLTVQGKVGGLVAGMAEDSPAVAVPGGGGVGAAASGGGSPLDRDDLVALRHQGMACPEEIGDGLVLYEARRVRAGEGRSAVQLSYSDGLVAVSVFEQRGRLDGDRLEGFSGRRVGDGTVWTRSGPPAWATWSTGGSVVTVVSDDPALIPAVVEAVPPGEDGGHGVLARLARAASRVAGWFNPYDG